MSIASKLKTIALEMGAEFSQDDDSIEEILAKMQGHVSGSKAIRLPLRSYTRAGSNDSGLEEYMRAIITGNEIEEELANGSNIEFLMLNGNQEAFKLYRICGYQVVTSGEHIYVGVDIYTVEIDGIHTMALYAIDDDVLTTDEETVSAKATELGITGQDDPTDPMT